MAIQPEPVVCFEYVTRIATSGGLLPGTNMQNNYPHVSRKYPIWLYGDLKNLGLVDTGGSITGVANVPPQYKGQVRVGLVYRTTGVTIAVTQLAPDSTFAFYGLDRSSTEYMVYIHLPGSYNAQVFDKIQPI